MSLKRGTTIALALAGVCVLAFYGTWGKQPVLGAVVVLVASALMLPAAIARFWLGLAGMAVCLLHAGVLYFWMTYCPDGDFYDPHVMGAALAFWAWLLGAAALGLATLGSALLRTVFRHPPRPGTCKRCGYDLTGNVSGRCPECGTPVGATVPKSV